MAVAAKGLSRILRGLFPGRGCATQQIPPGSSESEHNNGGKVSPQWVLLKKQGGQGIPDQTTTGDPLHECSKEVTLVLTDALIPGLDPFGLNEYMVHAHEARWIMCKKRISKAEVEIGEYLHDKNHVGFRRAERRNDCGAWLMEIQLLLNRTVFTVGQFHNSLWLKYGLWKDNKPVKL